MEWMNWRLEVSTSQRQEGEKCLCATLQLVNYISTLAPAAESAHKATELETALQTSFGNVNTLTLPVPGHLAMQQEEIDRLAALPYFCGLWGRHFSSAIPVLTVLVLCSVDKGLCTE